MSLPTTTLIQIARTVHAMILETVPRKPGEEFGWEMKTNRFFRYDVRAVLLVLDKACEAFGLDFDPNTLPQQSVFHTFPRLANLCAYVEYRLTINESGETSKRLHGGP